jgi:hypothetical protein
MGRMKGLFGLALLVGTGYVLWQVIPPIFNNYQLEDIITQEARAGSYSSRTAEDIQEIVFQKAREIEIPVTREQIKVERNGNLVSISVAYKVPVHLPVYPFDLTFNPSSKNQGL